MQRMPWDDLDLLLHLHRHGSMARAGKALQCDASTVSRRLRQAEARIGEPLFDRTPDGLHLTALGHRLLPHAEAAEAAVLQASHAVASQETQAEGVVRVAVASGFAAYVLAPQMAAFRAAHPGVRLEVVVSASVVDMSRREADIAVRFVKPQQGDLVMQKLPGAGAYVAVATRTYVENLEKGAPPTWIGWVPELAHLPDAQVLQRMGIDEVDVACNDLIPMVEWLRHDVGAMVLPKAVLATHPDLVELDVGDGLQQEGLHLPTYLVCHRSVRHVPRVKVVWEWLKSCLLALDDVVHDVERGEARRA